MSSPVPLEKIVEHHLVQNLGQKLTLQLVSGLVHHITQNIHKQYPPAPASEPTTDPEVNKDA